MIPKSFCEATITLILKPDKYTTKKKKSYRSVSLMDTDAKTLNKTLANQIQQRIKRIKLVLPQGHKDGSTHTNQPMWYTTSTKEN